MDEERNNVNEESRGLTFKDILFIIRKHWIAIIAFIIVGVAGGAAWSFAEKRVNPVYQSSGIIMVSPESNGTSTGTNTEYAFSANLTSTVVAFIKTNTVLDNVKAEQRNFVKSNLSVSNSSGNLMITVKYSSKTPEESQLMVNSVMKWAKQVSDDTEMVNGVETPVYHMLYRNLNVVDEAKAGVPISHTTRNIAIGLGAGIVLALGYVVLRELLDNTFKSSDEIERMLNLPVLAGIPDYHFDDEKKGGK